MPLKVEEFNEGLPFFLRSLLLSTAIHTQLTTTTEKHILCETLT